MASLPEDTKADTQADALLDGDPGAPISGQSRLNANAKSPLTGAIGDSQSGSFFPAELKFAGFDGIVIRGRSPKPVYLSIIDGQPELHDTAHLVGKLTAEVDEILKEDLGLRVTDLIPEIV